MYTSKYKNYTVTYPNKKEFKLLKKEIFEQEIYSIDLKSKTPTIFDVGAYIGTSCIYFKDKYPKAKIVAFEPNPNAFPILEDNIYGNNLKDIELHNTAISKTEGSQEFYIDNTKQDWFSTAGFIKNAWNGKQPMIPIQVKTEKLSKHIENDIDLIKIDTEGNELQILEEIEAKLHFVKNLIIEYHPINENRLKKILTILDNNYFKTEIFIENKKIETPTNELLILKAKRD
jgi:FkbM family methyltransferase